MIFVVVVKYKKSKHKNELLEYKEYDICRIKDSFECRQTNIFSKEDKSATGENTLVHLNS